MSLLSVNQLSIQFHGADAPTVTNLSFALEAGKTTAIVGESGSGKSITALSILKLNPALFIPSGSIFYQGQNLAEVDDVTMRSIRGNDISIIFQEPMTALNPLHTIRKQLAEIIQLHKGQQPKKQMDASIVALLEEVGLGYLGNRLHHYPHQLSGGERQRVMIAMAIANRPKLLIADEPTTALDVSTQAHIMALLRELQQKYQMALLLITHDLHLVKNIADKVIVMKQGSLIEEGTIENIFSQPKHAYTKALIDATHTSEPVTLVISDPQTIIEAKGLSVSYKSHAGFSLKRVPKRVALHPLDISVKEGETLGIVGESGSGKTTLGLALARLIPSQGIIVYLGEAIHTKHQTDLRSIRSSLQFVFQDPFSSLNPRMTIEQIIGEGLGIHFPNWTKQQKRDHIIDVLEKTGLSADMLSRYPHEFSGGQRQRINIARAMVLCPKCVIFDEPTSALDITLQTQIIALLKQFQKDYRMSYLFISHDIYAVRSISHSLIVLKEGHIVEHGDTATVFANPKHSYTCLLMDASGIHSPVLPH